MKHYSSNRPGVMPARSITNGQMVKEIFGSGKFNKKSFTDKKLVVDVCDICHKYIDVQGRFLHLRNSGYRIVCFKCINDNKLDCKRDKLVHQFYYSKNYDK